jgi:glycosyltransferase involved in cell wall biosynthesis
MSRIAFVANSYSGGGAELASRAICTSLAPHMDDLSFIAINDFPDDGLQPKVRTIRIGRKYRGSIPNLIISIIKFRKIVDSLKIELVVLNCELPEFFSLFLPRRIKRVVVEHTTKPWSRLPFLGVLVRQALRQKGAEWVAVSDISKIWPFRLTEITVIPNPLVNQPEEVLFPFTKIERIYFVGRLVDSKHPEMILHASLDTALPAIIIGEGNLGSALKEFSEKKSINTDFIGHSSQPWSLLKSGDIVIVPSAHEGDGLVVAEAILSGAPILLRDCPDLRRFNLPEVNYFMDSRELLNRIQEFGLQVDRLIPSQDIRNAVIDARGIEQVCNKWLNLINKLI